MKSQIHPKPFDELMIISNKIRKNDMNLMIINSAKSFDDSISHQFNPSLG